MVGTTIWASAGCHPFCVRPLTGSDLVVSKVAEGQVAGAVQGGAGRARAARGRPLTAVGVVIVVTTALALALRVYYQFTLTGFLLGVTEYDDGTYFGSALRLVTGIL